MERDLNFALPLWLLNLRYLFLNAEQADFNQQNILTLKNKGCSESKVYKLLNYQLLT